MINDNYPRQGVVRRLALLGRALHWGRCAVGGLCDRAAGRRDTLRRRRPHLLRWSLLRWSLLLHLLLRGLLLRGPGLDQCARLCRDRLWRSQLLHHMMRAHLLLRLWCGLLLRLLLGLRQRGRAQLRLLELLRLLLHAAQVRCY